jgi:hypothetical protein
MYKHFVSNYLGPDIAFQPAAQSRRIGTMALPDLPPPAISSLAWGKFLSHDPANLNVTLDGSSDPISCILWQFSIASRFSIWISKAMFKILTRCLVSSS